MQSALDRGCILRTRLGRLGPLEAVLRVSWGCLGALLVPSWVVFGPAGDSHEAPLGPLGAILGHPSAAFDALEAKI